MEKKSTNPNKNEKKTNPYSRKEMIRDLKIIAFGTILLTAYIALLMIFS